MAQKQKNVEWMQVSVETESEWLYVLNVNSGWIFGERVRGILDIIIILQLFSTHEIISEKREKQSLAILWLKEKKKVCGKDTCVS